MKIEICNCNPGVSHQPIISTDAKLLRRVRKDALERAERWEREVGWGQAIVCARYGAQQILERLRELREVQGE